MSTSRFVGASLLAALLAVPAAMADLRPDGRSAEGLPVQGGQVHRLNAVYRPWMQVGSNPPGVVTRGPGCPVIPLTRFRDPRPGMPQDFDFDNVQNGQELTLQLGFAQQEIAAVSFQIPDNEFPIKIELVQAILGSVATQATTTRYTILVWDGPPTGSPAFTAASGSDPGDPPDLVLPAGGGGNNAVIGDIQFAVDTGGDPSLDWRIEPIGDPGNPTQPHTVSIGIRIDMHNEPGGGNPCFSGAPSNRNAFPATEPGTCCTQNLLTFPMDNWLFGLNCGAAGCPPNGGWARFSQLSEASCFFGQCLGCRPSGDWALRLKYSSYVCAPPSEGACCAASGSCSVTTEANCSGTWTNGGVCSPNPCPQPSGACCDSATGGCTVTTSAACSGQWTLGGSCSPNPCPEPAGACCFGDTCQTLSVSTCTGFGGQAIAGQACGPNDTCPLGACCHPDGTCQIGQSQPACVSGGGTFQGVGTTCTPNNCPQPSGACCNTQTGFCALLTQAACAVIPNTAWQGPLTACEPNPCGQQSGACCTGTSCSVTTQGSCGGAFQGDGTACGPAGNPTTCCPANFNGSGGITVQDIFDFLAAYFAGNPAADFNQVGGITVQDIFDFLAAYFAGCA